ncbi:MAG: 30S ribosomal protein S11 [Mycoplasmoidaceae bacterium]|nr:MAG: 30S ribosomal protein S11 [Mycoplasmoidaceae bacterium]
MAEKKAKKPMIKKPVTKKKRKVSASHEGIIHIHSTANNTIVSLSDEKGNILNWASSGTVGYKGTKKSTPYSAGQAATVVAGNAKNFGITSVKIQVNGIGQGKDTAIRSIDAAGLAITELIDSTPIPHNGCKPPKKPR